MITRKYFPADKNYLLKEAQSNLEKELRPLLLEMIRKLYFAQFNPLGIEDDFVLSLKKASYPKDDFLEEPYALLAAVYRYQYGDNQLELLWDGSTHVDHYEKLWKEKYQNWLIDICISKPSFTRALIKFIFNLDNQMNSVFIEKYICSSILDHFNFKLYKKKGLMSA
ncbi:MAG: hypothetical protein AAFQ94_01335 [Bacteroidota bacterium]